MTLYNNSGFAVCVRFDGWSVLFYPGYILYCLCVVIVVVLFCLSCVFACGGCLTGGQEGSRTVLYCTVQYSMPFWPGL